PLANRFVISQFAFKYSGQGQPVGPFYECIGVTKTADPTGAWYRYSFLISQTEMNDYPKLGVWSDGYYMTINQYDTAGNWGGVGVAAFDREAMVAGQGASMVYLDGPSPDLMGLL